MINPGTFSPLSLVRASIYSRFYEEEHFFSRITARGGSLQLVADFRPITTCRYVPWDNAGFYEPSLSGSVYNVGRSTRNSRFRLLFLSFSLARSSNRAAFFCCSELYAFTIYTWENLWHGNSIFESLFLSCGLSIGFFSSIALLCAVYTEIKKKDQPPSFV